MDERILSLIKAQTALTFPTVKDDIPFSNIYLTQKRRLETPILSIIIAELG